MQEVIRGFRTQAAGAGTAERSRLAGRARRAIERLHKQFKHKIDDMLRRDTKRPLGTIGERERLGLEEQLRLATEAAIERLDHARQELGSRVSAEQNDAPDRPRD
jgi:hypothetical protein